MELYSLTWWGFIIAGLGLFLFGMSFFGDSLRKLAGNKLKGIIDKFTTNIFMGMLVGILVTAVFQSSSATTVLTIGLVSAGLMTFKQSIGIIMGANIGTTVTAFIIGLNLSEYAPFFVLLGVILIVFFSNQKYKQIGELILSFGLLFFGLSLMESSLKLLASEPKFIEIVQLVGNRPLLGMLVGTLGTAVIQSSSAFIGVIQSLYETTSHAGTTLLMILPLLFGSNIGTTMSSIIACSASNNRSAKRATIVHVMFNVIGTIIFMLLLSPYSSAMNWLSNILGFESKMQIALSHFTFNILTTLLLLPCANIIEKLVIKLIPEKEEEKKISIDLSVLDHNVIDVSPTLALNIAREQTIIMGNYARQSVDLLISFFNTNNQDDKNMIYKIEETVDLFNEKLTEFFHVLGSVQLSESEITSYGEILKTFRDIERISDHCENLVEFFDEYHKRNDEIHPASKEEIINMLTLVQDMIYKTMDTFANRSLANIDSINESESKLDILNKASRNNHVERLASSQDVGSKYIAVVFADIISNIERIGDHCTNIVENFTEAIKKKDN